MNVKAISLVTGTVFVCDVVEETNDTVSYKNGLALVPTENGVSFALVDLIANKGQVVTVYKHAMTHVPYAIVSPLEQNYRQLTGGIVVQQEPLLLPKE
jgi:hypothetical protein